MNHDERHDQNPARDPSEELRLQAWVDGELDGDPAAVREVTARVDRDAGARALAGNLRAFSRQLREAEPAPTVPESRDFFFSKIRRGIEQAERESHAQPAAATSPLRWLGWLVPVGAAALAAVLLLQPGSPVPGTLSSAEPAQALIDHEVETPSSDVSSLTFYAAKDSMTVVWLGRIDFM